MVTLALFANTASAQTQATQSILPAGMPANNEGFTIVPADPNGVNPRKFIYELKPGSSVTDYAYVKNFSGQKVTFALYGADPTTSNKGTLAYKTKAESGGTPSTERSGKDTGKWLQFEQPTLELGPTGAKMVKFTITVPADTSPGDYRLGTSMERIKQDTSNPGITIATRIVLHTEIKVTNDPKPVPKQGAAAGTGEEKSPWKIYYFWVSLLLFVVSLALVIRTGFINPKKEKSSAAAKKPVKKTTLSGVARKKSITKKNEGKRRNPRV